MEQGLLNVFPILCPGHAPIPSLGIPGRDIGSVSLPCWWVLSSIPSTAVLQGEYLGQKVAVKNIKCDVTAQAFLDETAVMT